ncbi:MAG: lipopolysaccharide heptosyltransferase II [Kiritimatiellae bacterium]|jgi:lipopolysaccharide heptosyltransferase I|nr:lipopolysaccharide heptosyltransferase II [Kiritimatiellia bacterium]
MVNGAKRILIVKLSSLGDILHALPAAHCLKNGLPAEIDWVVHPAYAELVKCFSDVSRTLVFPRRGAPAEFIRQTRLLRAEQYEMIIDLQGILKSALVNRLARGKQRIGPSFHREGSFLFYTVVAGKKNKNRHAVDEIMDVARYLHLPLLPPVFPMNIPFQLVSEPAPRIAMLPFSRWPSKNWPCASFARAGRELQENLDASIYIFGAAGDRPAAAEIARELNGRAVNLAGKTTLPQLAGLLREMDLVLTNDSGPMHLAAAFGKPTLALFGPTDPVLTGPYGRNHAVLKGKLHCQPCFSARCRFRDNSCMQTITPETVINTAMDMLGYAVAKERK